LKYRIISNGSKFKVQWKEFLFWNTVVVRVGVGLGVKPRLFDSFEQAAARIESFIENLCRLLEVSCLRLLCLQRRGVF
jgi:hypothetical protein